MDPQTNFSYLTLLASPSPSQQKALDKLLAEQQDPTSPNYHKWLTPEEYGSQFGLSQNDVNKITKWLASKGFTVISVAAGRNSIVFSGTATQIETAFGTEIHRYNIGKEEHFANSTAVKIPAAWAGVVTGIRGLNSFRMKPMNVKKRLHGDYYSSALQSQFLAPGDIATIYNINPLYNSSPAIDGTGQKLAIIGQTDIYLADINDFRSGFGLPTIPSSGNNSCTLNSKGVVVSCSNATNLGYLAVPGISDPGTPNICGDLPEADLDLEWSGATARNAQIIYVNAPASFDSNCNFIGGGSVEDALSSAINSAIAPVISMSYGNCELFANNDEGELQQANVEGVTVLNSSGDSAAAGCDGFTNSDNNLALGGLAVGYPASSQYVTGVGGTAVPFDDFNNWNTNNGGDGGTAPGPVPEQAWNDVDEFAALCAANFNPNFCSFYGITSPLAAQEALGIGGGGGGASNCFFETAQGICTGGNPQPSWQTVSIPGQASARFVPDVSLLATPNFPGYVWCTPVEYLSSTSPYDTETTSSCATSIANSVNGIVDASNNFVVFPSIVGGTSVSAPVFAGIVTLLNQYVVEKGIQGTPGLGNINPNLYYLAAYNQNAFHQITNGDSNVYCQPGTPSGQPAALLCPDSGVFGYQASNADTATGNGYNLVTGLGSVDVSNLAAAWVDSTKPVFTLAVPSISTVVNQPIVWNGTLTALNGYNTNVSLTCVNAPGTCGSVSFTPSTQKPLSTGASFQLAVGSSATGFSAPVTYNFDINGSDGTLTHTHSVSLTVDTDVSVPSSLTAPAAANAGQSTTTSMLVSPVGAGTFTAAITFACSGLPTGATCSFLPAQIFQGNPATQVTITIQTAGPFTGAASAIARPKLRSEKQRLWLPLSLPLAGMLLVGLAGGVVPRRYKVLGLCATLALTGLLVACGGGGSSSTPPPAVNISVSPSVANTLYPSLPGAPAQTQQFTAVVTPSTVSQTTTWSVTGGNAYGTISSTGLYTAPASLPSPTAVTVRATASSGASGSATVNLLTPTPSGPAAVTVTLREPSVARATSFNLTVN